MAMSEKIRRFLMSDSSYHLLLCLFYLWMLVGVFPLNVTYEGDGLCIIAGSSTMYNHGWEVPPALSYQYGMQPIIIYMIVAVKHLLPFLSCNAIYSLLSALMALLLVPLCVAFVSRVTGIRKVLVLSALILLPETYAVATYPNSSVFAFVFAMAGFLLLVKGASPVKYFPLLCVAPLFRIDVIIIYPVIFFLYLLQGKSLRRSIGLSVGAAVSVVAFMALTYSLLQANPLATLNHAQVMNNSGSLLTMVLIAIYSFYNSINLLLLPIGVACVARQRRFRLLMAALVPIILVHYFYRLNGGAAKHYLYLLPFVAIFTVHALQWLVGVCREHKVVRYACVTALVLFFVIGLRFDIPNMPWRNSDTCVSKQGPYLSLFHDTKSKMHWQVGIGSSLGFFTEDELMLFSGHLFYPFYIHEVKAKQLGHIRQVKDFLDSHAPHHYAVLALTWTDFSLYPSLLMEEGYRRQVMMERVSKLTKGDKAVLVLRNETDHDEKILTKAMHQWRQLKALDGVPIYVVTQSDSFIYHLDVLCNKGLCKKLMEGVYQIED